MLSLTSILALSAATLIAAHPSLSQRQSATLCTGTYSNALCCATDVLGVADLNCFNRTLTSLSPTSSRN